MLLYQILASTIYGEIQKKSYKNSKFQLSSSKGNEKFELPDASYSVSDFQDNFEYIIKKHDTFTDNPPIKYINIIEYT